MKISILGGGSWGTALAVHLAKNNHNIKIWEFFQEQADKMQNERICPLLPDAKLPKNIFVSSKMEEVLPNSELILLVVPSDKAETTLEQAKPFLSNQPIVICSKGFASNLKLLSEVIEGEVYCLYGPTHAEEVCKGMFSGITLAGKDDKLKKVFENENLKVEFTKDIIGVQVAASLKNILAVFIGVLDGMGLGDNAKAYVMTKGLEEIKEVGLKWGAKETTFYGLAGIGDMIVTCGSKHSRNRYAGEQIGKGRKLEEVTDEMKMIAEGITTIKEAVKLEEKFDIKLPLIRGLYEILFENKDPKEVIHQL